MAMASDLVDAVLQDIELLLPRNPYFLKNLYLREREREMAMASDLVDAVLQDIELLLPRNPYFLRDLLFGLRNLRTFLLYARGSSSSVISSLLSSLEDSLIRDCKDLHHLCLDKEFQSSHEFVEGVIQLKNCIRSFGGEIVKSYITLSDHCLLQSGYQLKEFYDYLRVNIADIMWVYDFILRQDPKPIDAFNHKLAFFINFFRFAELRGFEPFQLQLLLTRVHVVAVNAAKHCYQWRFVPRDVQKEYYDEFPLKFSELLQKINLVDPQIREIYVYVLRASNVSRSSHALTLETDKHVLGDFVDTLLSNISEALTYGDSYMASLKDQVPILYEGLRFLRTLLTKHLEKIDELHKRAKDLIGAAVNEAAIVICSLPVHELEEGLVEEMDFALLNFLENIKLIKVITSPFIFSKTNEHGFIDFLLENLKELPSCSVDSIAFAKGQIQTIQKDLVSLRSFLKSIVDDRKHDGKLQSLWNRVVEEAYKTHFVILSLVVGDIPNCSPLEFRTIIEEINLIKLESLQIVDNHYNSDSDAQQATNTSNLLPSQISAPSISKFVLPLDDEVNTIIEHLTSGSKKLDIISIVGMPGLGKTTLARSVYDNTSVRDLFHTTAWCVVSQVYKKKDLLLRILGHVDRDFSVDNYSQENEQRLEEKLKKCLLRKKYLIILDDVWDIEAWSCLERSFPDDANSSRILLTSRDSKVAKKINPDREPHRLRQLTNDECWELLQKKLSCIKSYPLDLGMKIAKNCRGLPLTVVIVAGILANSEQDDWEGIVGRLSLSALSNTDQCMDILELSFKKLPEKLKSCLLYFGLFPEDAEIAFNKLMWFWIAEGFIEKSEQNSLEDVAKDYMNDLIGRSLVMVSKEKSIGSVKTCRIHDLLHEFCMVKAKKEKFLSLLSGHDQIFTFHGQCDLQRLCVHSTPQDFEKSKLFCPGVHSLLFFSEEDDYANRCNISFIVCFFKLLKVLVLDSNVLGSTFPIEITLLVELRYLAIHAAFDSIPPAIANLSNLETLLVHTNKVLLPDTIWNMPKLRVLWSNGFFYGFGLINLDTSDLHNLETLSTLKLLPGERLEKIMRKLPNIRKLKCELSRSGESNVDCNRIVVMDFLSQLESLHLSLTKMDEYHIGFHFPLYIKKLSLSGFHWSIIPKPGELPNLLVLQLSEIHFEGDTWDMNEEWEFPKLKILELNSIGIVRWTGFDDVDHFPLLEKLQFLRCCYLKEVPSCLGDTTTLRMIKVVDCSESVKTLFLKIKEEQKENWGNEDLQVLS